MTIGVVLRLESKCLKACNALLVAGTCTWRILHDDSKLSKTTRICTHNSKVSSSKLSLYTLMNFVMKMKACGPIVDISNSTQNLSRQIRLKLSHLFAIVNHKDCPQVSRLELRSKHYKEVKMKILNSLPSLSDCTCPPSLCWLLNVEFWAHSSISSSHVCPFLIATLARNHLHIGVWLRRVTA